MRRVFRMVKPAVFINQVYMSTLRVHGTHKRSISETYTRTDLSKTVTTPPFYRYKIVQGVSLPVFTTRMDLPTGCVLISTDASMADNDKTCFISICIFKSNGEMIAVKVLVRRNSDVGKLDKDGEPLFIPENIHEGELLGQREGAQFFVDEVMGTLDPKEYENGVWIQTDNETVAKTLRNCMTYTVRRKSESGDDMYHAKEKLDNIHKRTRSVLETAGLKYGATHVPKDFNKVADKIGKLVQDKKSKYGIVSLHRDSNVTEKIFSAEELETVKAVDSIKSWLGKFQGNGSTSGSKDEEKASTSSSEVEGKASSSKVEEKASSSKGNLN